MNESAASAEESSNERRTARENISRVIIATVAAGAVKFRWDLGFVAARSVLRRRGEVPQSGDWRSQARPSCGCSATRGGRDLVHASRWCGGAREASLAPSKAVASRRTPRRTKATPALSLRERPLQRRTPERHKRSSRRDFFSAASDHRAVWLWRAKRWPPRSHRATGRQMRSTRNFLA